MKDDRYTLNEAAGDIASCWMMTGIIEGILNTLAAVFAAVADD